VRPVRTLPRAAPGSCIALFGGTFDPAHEGHAHVARTARRALGGVAVWWLVSPQNPLKARSSPLARRAASARAMAPHPRTHPVVTAEAEWGSAFTADTLRALAAVRPGVRFVLVMGGDTLSALPRFRRWRELPARAGILVVSRPGATRPDARAAALLGHAHRRLPAMLVAGARGWSFVTARLHPHASSALRGASSPQ